MRPATTRTCPVLTPPPASPATVSHRSPGVHPARDAGRAPSLRGPSRERGRIPGCGVSGAGRGVCGAGREPIRRYVVVWLGPEEGAPRCRRRASAGQPCEPEGDGASDAGSDPGPGGERAGRQERRSWCGWPAGWDAPGTTGAGDVPERPTRPRSSRPRSPTATRGCVGAGGRCGWVLRSSWPKRAPTAARRASAGRRCRRRVRPVDRRGSIGGARARRGPARPIPRGQSLPGRHWSHARAR